MTGHKWEVILELTGEAGRIAILGHRGAHGECQFLLDDDHRPQVGLFNEAGKGATPAAGRAARSRP